jgi:hypothetical protein
VSDLQAYADHLENEVMGLHAELHSMHVSRWKTPYACELLALMDSHLSALRLLGAYRSREGVPALLQSIAAASASATPRRSE